MNIDYIKIIKENYVWCLHNNINSSIEDPGNTTPVTNYLNYHNLTLTDILITHHHKDHIGGVSKLLKKYNCNLYSPAGKATLPYTNILVNENDTVYIKSLDLEFNIIGLPGHTLNHIAYFGNDMRNNILFCGDTLFSCGCGYIFEGSYEQMYNSLLKIRNLPPSTLIYPTHEYTLNNIRFALQVEPENKALQQRYQECLGLIANNKATLPINLTTECATNPFLRCDQPELINQLYMTDNHMIDKTPLEIFKFIREWKNNWNK